MIVINSQTNNKWLEQLQKGQFHSADLEAADIAKFQVQIKSVCEKACQEAQRALLPAISRFMAEEKIDRQWLEQRAPYWSNEPSKFDSDDNAVVLRAFVLHDLAEQYKEAVDDESIANALAMVTASHVEFHMIQKKAPEPEALLSSFGFEIDID